MKTNPWLENSKKNLIPLSIAESFNDALSEWFFTGDVEDYGHPSVECEMCEHPELRYHYEIENNNNHSQLWVGSSCILRFQEIDVYDEDGQLLTTDNQRREQLKKALNKKLENIMLEPLRKLWKSGERRGELRNKVFEIVESYRENKGFSPKDLVFIFEKLDSVGIKYEKYRYKVNLRTEKNKLELQFLSSQNKIQRIKTCLSPQQLSKFSELLKRTET